MSGNGGPVSILDVAPDFSTPPRALSGTSGRPRPTADSRSRDDSTEDGEGFGPGQVTCLFAYCTCESFAFLVHSFFPVCVQFSFVSCCFGMHDHELFYTCKNGAVLELSCSQNCVSLLQFALGAGALILAAIFVLTSFTDFSGSPQRSLPSQQVCTPIQLWFVCSFLSHLSPVSK